MANAVIRKQAAAEQTNQSIQGYQTKPAVFMRNVDQNSAYEALIAGQLWREEMA